MRLFSIRSRWSRQTNLRWSLRISAPGSRCDSHRIWKPLQMPSTGIPRPRGLDHLGHHRGEPGDRAAAQVVAVREATRQDHRVDAAQVVVAVPERDRLVAADADRALRVDVVERAGEGDDADLHAVLAPSTRDGEVLDHRVGEQRLGHLPDLLEHLVGDLPGQLELEPLALADVGHAGEAEPRQGAEHRLALGVEDLRLGHHVDDDLGHGPSLDGTSAADRPGRLGPWSLSGRPLPGPSL